MPVPHRQPECVILSKQLWVLDRILAFGSTDSCQLPGMVFSLDFTNIQKNSIRDARTPQPRVIFSTP